MDQFLTCTQSPPWDPEHIQYFPCKNVEIFLEKSDEREFLFGVKLRANLELLVGITGIS
jgi:hypothetical protein